MSEKKPVFVKVSSYQVTRAITFEASDRKDAETIAASIDDEAAEWGHVSTLFVQSVVRLAPDGAEVAYRPESDLRDAELSVSDPATRAVK
jgi:hypothetical protein